MESYRRPGREKIVVTNQVGNATFWQCFSHCTTEKTIPLTSHWGAFKWMWRTGGHCNHIYLYLHKMSMRIHTYVKSFTRQTSCQYIWGQCLDHDQGICSPNKFHKLKRVGAQLYYAAVCVAYATTSCIQIYIYIYIHNCMQRYRKSHRIRWGLEAIGNVMRSLFLSFSCSTRVYYAQAR